MSSVSAPESRSAAHLPHLITILLLPALVTLVLPDWMYTFPGAIDPWVYTGYFRHLDVYAEAMFNDLYYGTRLAWLLPGHAAYSLFDAMTANLVLHISFYVASTVAVYAIVALVAGRLRALFAAVTFALYLPNIRTFGDDYVAAGVITYALLATLALVHGSRRPAVRWPAVLAGAAAAAMVHSNLGAVMLLPSLAIWALPLSRDTARWRALLRVVADGCIGLVLCTGALAVFSVLHGGRWLFFMANFTFISRTSSSRWAITGLDWIATSPCVYLLFALLAAAAAAAFRGWREQDLSEHQSKAIASFGLAFLPLAVWDFVGPGGVLALPYYDCWLYGSGFVMIGVALLGSEPRTRSWYPAVTVVAGLLLLSIGRRSWPEPMAFPFLVVAVCGGLAIVAASLRSPLVSAGALATMLLFLHIQFNGYGYSPARADIFRVVDEATRITERFLDTRRPRYLVTAEPRLHEYTTAAASIYLSEYSIVSSDFPRLTPEGAGDVQDRAIVVIMSGDPSSGTMFDEAFAPYGLRAEPLASERIATRAGDLFITVLRARSDAVDEAQTTSGIAPGGDARAGSGAL